MEPLHPMLLPRGFVVQTPPLREVVDLFQQYVDDGEFSMRCMAPSRHGKTVVLEYIEQRVQQTRALVPLFHHATNFRERNASAKFWHSLRTGSEEHATSGGYMGQRPREALVNHIRNECDKAETVRVAFLFDEAQNLTVEQLDMLKMLTETLVRADLVPFTLMMAQPQILLMPDQLKAELRYDLVDRFFTRLHRLRGLRHEEFQGFCLHYDTAVWPEGSGITYTRHFVPTLWEGGWRLTQQAQPLWAAFVRKAQELRVYSEPFELGVKFPAKAILHLLSRLTQHPGLRVDAALLDEAVEKSEFAMHASAVGNVLLAVEQARVRMVEREQEKQKRGSSSRRVTPPNDIRHIR